MSSIARRPLMNDPGTPRPEAQAVEVPSEGRRAATGPVESTEAVSAEFDDLEVISARQAKLKGTAGRLEILDLRLEQVPLQASCSRTAGTEGPGREAARRAL